MLPNSRLRQGTVTFAQAIGAKANEPLELNTFEAATCHLCGLLPKLHTHTTPKGREIAMWIPAQHACPKKGA